MSDHLQSESVRVDIALPSLLQSHADGQSCIPVMASTLQGCFDALFAKHPLLQRHLFTESGQQRPHVLFFHNEDNTRWLDSLNIPVREGDTLTILQAVSGG
ncbi:MAG: MoaD/ThiS family protein [Verrucomicrobiales bacterium]|nr:MoaD/ThiS family protein [Verrucomicrobiae bacterium]